MTWLYIWLGRVIFLRCYELVEMDSCSWWSHQRFKKWWWKPLIFHVFLVILIRSVVIIQRGGSKKWFRNFIFLSESANRVHISTFKVYMEVVSLIFEAVWLYALWWPGMAFAGMKSTCYGWLIIRWFWERLKVDCFRN